MGILVGDIAAAQALVVALVLLWAGVWKIAVPRARAIAAQSALARLLRSQPWAATAHLALGVGEVSVAILLLALPPVRVWALGLATLLTLGFLGYLILAWRLVPDAPCACMGGRAARISWRSLLRAGLLLVLSVAGWPVREFWAAAIVARPWVLLLLALEVGALWVLSPEFGGKGVRAGLHLSRRVQRALRLRLDPGCARVRQDFAAIEHVLQDTAAYRSLQPALGNRTDAWREGCWDFIAYGALYERQVATVIFAAPALFDPREVSAAVVADADNTVLLAMPSQQGTVPPLTS